MLRDNRKAEAQKPHIAQDWENLPTNPPQTLPTPLTTTLDTEDRLPQAIQELVGKLQPTPQLAPPINPAPGSDTQKFMQEIVQQLQPSSFSPASNSNSNSYTVKGGLPVPSSPRSSWASIGMWSGGTHPGTVPPRPASYSTSPDGPICALCP